MQFWSVPTDVCLLPKFRDQIIGNPDFLQFLIDLGNVQESARLLDGFFSANHVDEEKFHFVEGLLKMFYNNDRLSLSYIKSIATGKENAGALPASLNLNPQQREVFKAVITQILDFIQKSYVSGSKSNNSNVNNGINVTAQFAQINNDGVNTNSNSSILGASAADQPSNSYKTGSIGSINIDNPTLKNASCNEDSTKLIEETPGLNYVMKNIDSMSPSEFLISSFSSAPQLMCHGAVISTGFSNVHSPVSQPNNQQKAFFADFFVKKFNSLYSQLTAISESISNLGEKLISVKEINSDTTAAQTEEVQRQIADAEREYENVRSTIKISHDSFIEKFGKEALIKTFNESSLQYCEYENIINNIINEKGKPIEFRSITEKQQQQQMQQQTLTKSHLVPTVISSDLINTHCKKLADQADEERKRWFSKKQGNVSTEIFLGEENDDEQRQSSEGSPRNDVTNSNDNSNKIDGVNEFNDSSYSSERSAPARGNENNENGQIIYGDKMDQYISSIRNNVMTVANCSGSFANFLIKKKNTTVVDVPNPDDHTQVKTVTVTPSMLNNISLDEDPYNSNKVAANESANAAIQDEQHNDVTNAEDPALKESFKGTCFNKDAALLLFHPGNTSDNGKNNKVSKAIDSLNKIKMESERALNMAPLEKNSANTIIGFKQSGSDIITFESQINNSSNENQNPMNEENTSSSQGEIAADNESQNGSTSPSNPLIKLNNYSCASDLNNGVFMQSTDNGSDMQGKNKSEFALNNPLDGTNVLNLESLSRNDLLRLYNKITSMLVSDKYNKQRMGNSDLSSEKNDDLGYRLDCIAGGDQDLSMITNIQDPSQILSYPNSQNTSIGQKADAIAPKNMEIEHILTIDVIPQIRQALLTNSHQYLCRTKIKTSITAETFKLMTLAYYDKTFLHRIVYTIFGPKLNTDPTLHSPIPNSCEIPYDVSDPFKSLNDFFSDCRMMYAVQYRKKNHIKSHRREWLEFYCHRSGSPALGSANQKQLKPCGCNHKIQVFRSLNSDESPVAPYVWYVSTTNNVPHQYHIPGTIDDVIHLSLADHIEQYIADVITKHKKSSLQIANEICKQNTLLLEQRIRRSIYTPFISDVKKIPGAVLIRTSTTSANALLAHNHDDEVTDTYDSTITELYCNASAIDVQNAETMVQKIIEILKVHGAFMPTQKTITNIRNRLKKTGESLDSSGVQLAQKKVYSSSSGLNMPELDLDSASCQNSSLQKSPL